MKLHLGGLGDHAQTTISIKYVNPDRVLIAKDLKKKKKHNQAMLEIAFTLSCTEFNDIKGFDSTKNMWDSLHTIYGGDTDFVRAKYESLRGKFNDMKMQ